MRYASLRLSASVIARIGLLALFSLLLGSQSASAQSNADMILHNGKILTVDKDFSTAQAVAVTGNKISAVGQNEDVLKAAGPNTQVIDLKGRMVIPGLIDTHLHIIGPGNYADGLTPDKTRSMTIDWRGVASVDDVLNQIKGYMDKYHFKPGEWLYFNNRLEFTMGYGGATDSVTKAKILYDDLNAKTLDKVAPNNPIVLTLGIPDENGLLVNGKAIEILWKNDGPFIKKYGRFWIDQGGLPEGHLEPPLTRLILNKYTPRLTAEQMAPGIEKLLQELNANGMTALSTKIRMNGLDAYKLLDQRGELTMRLAYGLGWDYFGSVKDPAIELKKFEGSMGTGGDKIWVVSMAPSSVDGASTRACTNQKRSGGAFGAIDSWFPTGQCHTDSEYRGGHSKYGPAPIQANYFKEWVMTQAKYGLRLANDHVAGDRSVENLLSMVEDAQKQYGAASTKLWSFDHCVLVDPRDFKRAAKDGVMFSCAPKYLRDVAPNAAVSYGDTIANTFIVPVKSMMAAGIKVVFESDQDSYKWDDIQMLLTRKDKDGKVWGPQERLDRPTALRMITSWAAEYVLKADKIGTIERGKLADLAVLDKDYLTVPVEEVKTIEPQLTILDGKIVYVHPNFSSEYNLKPAGAVVNTYKDLRARRPAGRGFIEAGASGG